MQFIQLSPSFSEVVWNGNVALFNFINHNLQNPVFDFILPIVTHFGGFEFLLALLIVIILYAHFKNKKTLKKFTILALIALLFSGLMVFLLKHLIHEPRPFVSFADVHLLVVEDDPLSFPSGHTTSTLAVVTFFILNMKELAKKHYRIIDVLLVIFAIAIPFSRIYVGVHYPVDVIAGFIVGIVGALIVNHFKDKIWNIFDK